jgi:hypothetical protein
LFGTYSSIYFYFDIKATTNTKLSGRLGHEKLSGQEKGWGKMPQTANDRMFNSPHLCVFSRPLENL